MSIDRCFLLVFYLIVPLVFSRLVPAGKSCYHTEVRIAAQTQATAREAVGVAEGRAEVVRQTENINSAEWAVMKVPNGGAR